ncbi:MAG: glutamate synthase large subunit, partial [Elusimicrobia bacterium]|nr:glutamate synthase large subunit [Elusimicrobiota bacterium]
MMRINNFNQSLYDPRFEHDSCGVGFICSIKGKKSNEIVKQGLEILQRLSHRGATGADPLTGDGAGILIQTPHEFFSKVCAQTNIKLPQAGEYGTGLIFLPQESNERDICKKIFEDTIKKEGHFLLGWREVPVDDSKLGKSARETEPQIEQVFVGKNKSIKDQIEFERKLYVLRKKIENAVESLNLKQKSFFYITNISSRTFLYKGLLKPDQLDQYFLDLKDNSLKSAISVVHSRYSTNTFPTWDLAQPFRFVSHNGEINTLRGNINWMKAKESLLKNPFFGEDIENIKPIINEEGSDSAIFDNVFELLSFSGRSLSHSIAMMIPPAWERNKFITKEIRDFYQYNECLMEPWDGPAAIAFTDGVRVGAVLDRNGLRPARYIVTKDEHVIMASEVGVLDIDPKNILESGRLEPGKIFFINTDLGRIMDDSEVKSIMARQKPYGKWLKENLTELESLPSINLKEEEIQSDDLIKRLKAFGYTREDLKIILKPMIETAQEPVGSMGNDTPYAVLSQKPQNLYGYFRQLFAQVTNPPIDPIREELVMDLESFMGKRENLLDETPEHCKKLKIKNPILTNHELFKIKNLNLKDFKSKTISILFKADEKGSFLNTMDRICREAESAIKENCSIIILSDRGVNKNFAALPALIAVGAVHQYLVKKSLRSHIGLILESAEPREVHHFAVLLGFGVGFINPYMAYETIKYMIDEKQIDLTYDHAIHNYIKAASKGVLKILSKMGISTIRSYRGAQIFEILGLHSEIVQRCFKGAVSRIGGADFEIIEKETILRHKEAYHDFKDETPLNGGGHYQWKRDGEFHLWNPDTISALQDAVRNNDEKRYREFAGFVNNQSPNPTTLRSLLKFKTSNSIPIEQVEPVSEIVKRFATGAMSFGSISRSAHETMAIAMNRLGAKSNTGEGGEDPARFAPLPRGDSKRSAIKQVASGRFGVNINYLTNADELQIKIAQGAKPGEGGQLPGHKVSAIIARTRYTTQGVTLISPPPHHDIYSIEDLAQLIFDLKNANPRARISVKLVSEIGVGTVAAGVAKGHADMILISGGDGGTGASPLSSIKHAGLPWELGLSETHQTLLLNNLRSRVRLQTDGQLRTGKDLAIAALLGAEEFGFATAVLVVLGCIMLRHCNLNNCSVGIATQDELLERRFTGRPEHIVNYFNFIGNELREIMAGLGFKKIEEMVGRSDLLELNNDILPWKAKKIDFSKILFKPQVPESYGTYCSIKQDHGIENVLDKKLIELSDDAIKYARPVKIDLEIKNSNRSIGTMLSNEICEIHGEEGLPENTIICKLKGFAGQSFGAFLIKGVTLDLEGMANDYVGKGISGGKIIIYPFKGSDYRPHENIIIGNTSFYGAISGEAYIRGVAGERFCIRNSGLYAVVEGVGDHGCEYMTGGIVIVLGKTGRNFAAGMSGGTAYIYDEDGSFKDKCNMEMVELETIGENDIAMVR